MRINSNKKVHKLKRDPYKTLIRLVLILVAAVAVGVGVFYFCSVSVTNDYLAKRRAIEQENTEKEVEFNARMNELRSNANAFMDPLTGEVSAEDLPFWERTIDGLLWRIEDEGKSELENTSMVTMERADLLLGGLTLVNPWHMIPADYSYDTLVSVGVTSGYKIQVDSSNVRLFPNAYEALAETMDAAAKEGHEFYLVREGYRSSDEQTEMFNKKMEELSKDYSGDILIEQAKKEVNYPGTSEYQTGMAFRMDHYNRKDSSVAKQKLQESDRGKWLTENCWKYGIIFRFPVDNFPNANWESKTYKTGITTRMSLYRYVGKAHSAAMRVMDYCLEEYIEFLIEHPHLTVYEDGKLRYEIYRIKANDGDTSFTLPVPNPAAGFQASFDNMGGIVLAYSYN